MKKLVISLLIIFYIFVSCKNIQRINSNFQKRSPKVNIETIVNKKQNDIFAREKCWWASEKNVFFKKNGLSFARCSISVSEYMFPSANQLEAPTNNLTKKLNAECLKINSNNELVDYFWSKEGYNNFILYGLCLKPENDMNESNDSDSNDFYKVKANN